MLITWLLLVMTMLSKQKLIENILGVEKIKQIDMACSGITDIAESSEKALDILEVAYKIAQGNISTIPAEGRVIIAANHPFGGIEGLIIINLIASIRPDFKVIVNRMLAEISILEKHTILVDVFAKSQANSQAIRTAKKALDSNEALIIFPAGEVSSYSIKSKIVVDPKWHKILGYLSKKTDSDIIPINFSGRNGPLFQALGLIHPLLRTSMLPRELLNKKHQEIKLSIGSRIVISDWPSIEKAQQITDFTKLNSYILDASTMLKPHARLGLRNPKPLAKLPSWAGVYQEITHAKSAVKITENHDYEVYIVEGHELSIALLALGILREQAFRLIGEGTGETYDLDQFDKDYQHIILIKKTDKKIAGAYRMLTFNAKTKRKSYTETLLSYSPDFRKWLEPAIELGRAFIHPDEQKNNNTLSLIWQGIFLYMSRHNIVKLYGTVSIPANASPLAKELILHFLAMKHMSRLPKGKLQAKHKVKLRTNIWRNLGLDSVETIKQMNWILAQISPGDKFPGLIKHYLNLGSKCFAFSEDPDFANVTDCLFVLDLSKHYSPIVKRLVGKDLYGAWLKQ